MQIDEVEIRRAMSVLRPTQELTEIRVIYEDGKIYSGYFRDADTMITCLNGLPKKQCNIYIIPNSLVDGLDSRTQYEKFIQTKITTNDNEIKSYEWLMVDLDPKRPKGISSTEEQYMAAYDLAQKVFEYLTGLGFEKPLVAKSGNGIHLLCHICLVNNDENKNLLKKCLQALDMLFGNEVIGIDQVTFNPARICKLYGTRAEKGSDTKDRPWRMAKILSSANEYGVTKKIYLEKLASVLPEAPEKPQGYNNYRPTDFNIEEWMDKYGLRYKKTSYEGGIRYILDECPFDSNHKGKDAAIFVAKDGGIGFHCFHNSCADKTWKDVRLLFEPDAYEKRQNDYQQRMYKPNYKAVQERQIKHIEAEKGKPIFVSALDVFNMPYQEETFVKTGITDIDKKLRGLQKGYVSLWSGLRSSAKSTVLSEIALNAIQNDNKVLVYSGELTNRNFMRWMNLQAAGKRYSENGQYEGFYVVPRSIQGKIATWLGDKFKLYNNDYGNDYLALAEQIKTEIEKNNVDLVILDNLMALNLTSLSSDKWQAQTDFVFHLQTIAKQNNVHIAFVAHPRKSLGFLRLEDISGTADLTNAVDNAFIVHRVNHDFMKRTKEEFQWTSDNEIYKSTNVIEICKDRANGTQDYFIPLWYEVESKRLKNSETENINYGWQELLDEGEKKDDFIKVDDIENPFGEITDYE